LVADSLISWLTKQGVFAQGYADDGVVNVCGKVFSTMSEIMQRILWGVEEWCKKRDLRVNPVKTVIIFLQENINLNQSGQLPFIVNS